MGLSSTQHASLVTAPSTSSLHIADLAAELQQWATKVKYTAKDIAAYREFLHRNSKDGSQCIDIASHFQCVPYRRRHISKARRSLASRESS